MRFLKPAVLLFLFFYAAVVFAEGEEQPLTPAQQEARNAFQAAVKAMQSGPAKVVLGGQASLNLPAGYGFIPKTEGSRFMQTVGNSVDDRFQGLVMPNNDSSGWWFIEVAYNPEGYIKDDDAKSWNADELLNSLNAGTQEGNKDRAARGIPEIEVAGWVEKPQYDPDNHRLVWSVAVRDKGQAPDTEEGVNYNTLMLGREGYISMNLITGRNSVESLKPIAKTLLAGLEFDNGKRYADFNASTDKVAEYGLAALVAGVAAKKLGLMAVIAAFVAKFAKIILIAAAAALGGLGKLFGKKKEA